MTSMERVKAVLEGRPVDRPPFTAWGPHMNMEDRHIGDFTKATCDYEENYGFDIVKVMPNGIYHTEDWGQEVDWTEDCDIPNFLLTRKTAFEKLEDWANATVKDVTRGAYGREVEVVRRVVEHFKGQVPVIATVFSPIQTIQFASGCVHKYLGLDFKQMYLDGRLDRLYPMCEYFEAHKKEYEHVMEVLTETTINLMRAFLDAGASGFFYGMFPLCSSYMSPENFEKYVKPYDMRVLNAVKDDAMITMLHIHGEHDLMIDSVLNYPVNCFNWEDSSPDNPSIAEMRRRTDKVLVGGLDRHSDLLGGDREKIKQTIRRRVGAAMAGGGNKLILSGGCEWPRKPTHRFYVWKEVMDEIAAGK